jgi:hypothetical protein
LGKPTRKSKEGKMKNIFEKISNKEWEHFLEQLKENKLEIDKIDVKALSPKDTNLEILHNFLRDEYGLTLKPILNIREIKAQQVKYENLMREQIELQEQIAEKSFMESLEAIEKDKTTDAIEKIYFIPKQYAKMVGHRFVNGLILYGGCGLGKTYSVIRAYKEDNIPFCICGGYMTPLQLYTYLFEHRTENIILDDMGNLLQNPIVLNMLKEALYSAKGVRVIHYDSTSPKLDVPREFVFEGTISILVNEIENGHSEDFKAVADRVLFYELKLAYEQIISILYEIAKQGYKELSREQRFMIVKWIKENTSLATKNINLRFLFKCYEFYRYNIEKWEQLARESIINDERIAIVNELLKKFHSVKEAEKEFISVTGLSRRTFYSIKKRLSAKVQ